MHKKNDQSRTQSFIRIERPDNYLLRIEIHKKKTNSQRRKMKNRKEIDYSVQLNI